MAKKPVLTPAELRKLVSYDAETGVFRWRPRAELWFESRRSFKVWNKSYAGEQCFHTPDTSGYATAVILGRLVSGHRIAWAIHYGEWPADQIDHINGDKLDNRIRNLRVVTALENSRNSKRPVNNTSGVVGVRYSKRLDRWLAAIGSGPTRQHLGCFTSFEDAVNVRKEAERKLGYHPNHGRAA
jgi:hypothetical protein